MRPNHIKALSLTGLFVAGVFASSPPLVAGETATLKNAEPFRLQVIASGSPRQVTVSGTGFEMIGHPNRDEYMHWQIRRDDEGWQPCAQWKLSSARICHSVSWSSGAETIEIGGSYVKREGFVELRVFHGLAGEDEPDPHKAASPTEWSNIIRVPVVVPGPPPKIVSLSQEKFPTNGKPDEYTFLIEASGLTGTPAVVFRGDVVVFPERVIGGKKIQVSVPEVYRLKKPGEIPLAVRTDKGGDSKEKYIRFVAPIELQLVTEGKKLKSTAGVAGSMKPSADIAEKSSGQAIASAGGPPPSGPCMQGFVWREATPNDHACVTPARRSLAAQQNHDALTHGVAKGGKMFCSPGFVWREAVAGDQVCVTPQERAQAAEDNRLASSRVAE